MIITTLRELKSLILSGAHQQAKNPIEITIECLNEILGESQKREDVYMKDMAKISKSITQNAMPVIHEGEIASYVGIPIKVNSQTTRGNKLIEEICKNCGWAKSIEHTRQVSIRPSGAIGWKALTPPQISETHVNCLYEITPTARPITDFCRHFKPKNLQVNND